MPGKEQKEIKEAGREINAYGKYTGIAFQMFIIIAVFAFAGYKTDEALHHGTKWVTAVLSLAGVFIALYLVIRSVKN